MAKTKAITKKEAFAQAEDEYRQARANSYIIYKELCHLKDIYARAQQDEQAAMRNYYHYIKPTTEALKYEKYLDEIGLR